MSENLYLFILLIMSLTGMRRSLIKYKWAQIITCILFSFLFVGRSLVYDWSLTEFEFKNQRFLINNSARIIQHSLLMLLVLKVTYKDHRAILPLIISTVIVVFYCLSNIVILSYPLDSVNSVVNGSRDIQKVLYSIRIPLGAISLLSLIDYGENVCVKLFRNVDFPRNPFIGNLLPSIYLAKGSYKITKKEKACR